jgi:protein-L-isoaspartate O-methyltransferase
MSGFSTSLLFTSLLLTTAPGQDPAPKTYLGREIAQTMHWMGASWLIRHKRDQEEASVEMRAQLILKPGMVACDMGSGNGYHTIPMAKAVAPNGKVFASEIQQEMLTMLDAMGRTIAAIEKRGGGGSRRSSRKVHRIGILRTEIGKCY